jgi:hypothetical protein
MLLQASRRDLTPTHSPASHPTSNRNRYSR